MVQYNLSLKNLTHALAAVLLRGLSNVIVIEQFYTQILLVQDLALQYYILSDI